MTEPVLLSAPEFRVGAAISYGWRRTWRNFWWFALVSIVFWAISAVAGSIGWSDQISQVDWSNTDPNAVVDQLTHTTAGALSMIGSLVQFLVSAFLSLGLIRIALGVTSGDRVRLGRVFSFQGYGRFLLASIIVGIIAVVGFAVPFLIGLALSAATNWPIFVVLGVLIGIVLAIVLALGLSLFGYVIVDKNAPGISSLKASWALVIPRFGALLGLEILIALISVGIFIAAVILGVLMLLLGLLITLPVAGVIVFGLGVLAMGYAYRTLSGEAVV